MTNSGIKRTAAQRRIFERRYQLAMIRWGQRRGARFRKAMLDRKRLNRAKRHPRGYFGAFLDEIRRA